MGPREHRSPTPPGDFSGAASIKGLSDFCGEYSRPTDAALRGPLALNK